MLERLASIFVKKEAPPVTQTVDVEQLEAFDSFSGVVNSVFDGEKFPGGFGATQLQWVDYQILRERSHQLFTENLYARGVIRRLVTNEIHIGLNPKLLPEEPILNKKAGDLDEWASNVEARFRIWGKNAKMCDWLKADSFSALQAHARLEALIDGDVLVVMRTSRSTKLPMVQLIEGSKVQSPTTSTRSPRKNDNTITHGVERDSRKRVVAYWARQTDGTVKRLPAFGEKSGKRIAWLVFGTDKRYGDVRGQPLLSLVLQSLKEMDRYKDSAQRKALVNSIMAMFIQKDADKMGTTPMSSAAIKHGRVSTTDQSGGQKNVAFIGGLPGVIAQELQTGEKPVLLGGQGTDVQIGQFEEIIMNSVAWANQIPPEILRLSFSSNYSASAAAINEFKIYLSMFWGVWGEKFCNPIFDEWFISEVLLQNIPAAGFLESWRNPSQYDTFGAWLQKVWYGTVKPSTDMTKAVKASKELVASAFSTHTKESWNLTGTDFNQNVKQLARENRMLVEAKRPLAEFEAEFNQTETDGALVSVQENTEELLSLVEDKLNA